MFEDLVGAQCGVSWLAGHYYERLDHTHSKSGNPWFCIYVVNGTKEG
jgi:hypothetical protein